jgi:hypothetical protein
MDLMNHPLLLLRYRYADAVLRKDDVYLMSGRRPLDIMRMARLFLSEEILWTSEALARDDAGNNVRPNNPRASSWSVEGALALMSNESATLPLYFARVLDHVIHRHFPTLVSGNLDSGSASTFGEFESVFSYELAMQVLDIAIQELERAQVHP